MKNATEAIAIRGNMYTLMSLVLHSTSHAEIVKAVHQRVLQAPAFLSNIPVIVDFSAVSIPPAYNFNLLFKVIRQQKLLPVAVRGLPEQMKDQLQGAGVPVVEFNASRSDGSARDHVVAEPSVLTGPPGQTLLIPRSLRAGERCYAQDADLIVVGSTLPTNEIIADGHIHVYGALQGHAVCGFQGNRSARIFCQKLEATTVSVAGTGQSEVPVIAPPAGVVQVALDGTQLLIEACNG